MVCGHHLCSLALDASNITSGPGPLCHYPLQLYSHDSVLADVPGDLVPLPKETISRVYFIDICQGSKWIICGMNVFHNSL